MIPPRYQYAQRRLERSVYGTLSGLLCEELPGCVIDVERRIPSSKDPDAEQAVVYHVKDSDGKDRGEVIVKGGPARVDWTLDDTLDSIVSDALDTYFSGSHLGRTIEEYAKEYNNLHRQLFARLKALPSMRTADYPDLAPYGGSLGGWGDHVADFYGSISGPSGQARLKLDDATFATLLAKTEAILGEETISIYNQIYRPDKT